MFRQILEDPKMFPTKCDEPLRRECVADLLNMNSKEPTAVSKYPKSNSYRSVADCLSHSEQSSDCSSKALPDWTVITFCSSNSLST